MRARALIFDFDPKSSEILDMKPLVRVQQIEIIIQSVVSWAKVQ